MRCEETDMGRDDENFNQNSCSDSLKSLLKKPGVKGKSCNRVVFNENKNEFFDADYIILIREECEYDDDEDDEICTCNEMASRIYCESNCGCNAYDFHEQIPLSPKFTPPIEFVDSVTLSPPEGYKDMELDDRHILAIQQLTSSVPKAAVCKECIANKKEAEQESENLKTSEAILGNQTIVQELEEDNIHLVTSPVSGILKGGLLWKHHGCTLPIDTENSQNRELKSTPDKESNRAVRFIENVEELDLYNNEKQENYLQLDKKENNDAIKLSAQETTDMLLTFKFGNHVLISNSLKPNSAVRQLFPDTKTKDLENESSEHFILNSESLHTFDETKMSKLSPKIKKCDKRLIEHRTFKRSVIRYEPKTKKTIKKEDNSLIERIKLLTCDLDETDKDLNNISDRISPAGEESHENQELSHLKNSSPSSSTSSNSSSLSSTYKKITDLFAKKEKSIEINSTDDVQTHSTSDLGGPQVHNLNRCQVKVNTIIDNKRQLLSTLVPLTACVNVSNSSEYYYNMSNDFANGTISSSTNTEFFTENINEDITVNIEDFKVNTPDVLAGTPSATESIDKLMQQNSRIGGINTQCYREDQLKKEDDEHNDYGFNKRPSVQGVKHRFGASTEIFNQIQNHLEDSTPNTKLVWPYYSESSFKENNQNISKTVPEGINTMAISPQLFKENNSYQNNYNNKITKETCNTNLDAHSGVIGIEVDYNEYYLPQSRNINNRPLSPPPQDFSRNYHAMVYIPYNQIQECRSIISPSQYYQTNEIMKPDKQIQQNIIYDDQFYQQNLHQTEVLNSSNMLPVLTHRSSNMYLRSNQIHSLSSTNKSPLVAQTSVKSTQTFSAPLLACSYFHNINCKSISPIRKNFENYNNTNNRHNLPALKTRYPNKKESIMLEENNINYSRQISNENKDYVDLNNYLSSKKLKFIERGVPEGAACLPPVDSTTIKSENSYNIITSPSSSHFKSFYAMNV